MPGVVLANAVLAGMLAASAVVDARTRALPNPLAALLALTGAACALAGGGASALAAHLAFALAVCGALLGFELSWRRLRGAPGQGMGDIKALFALVLAHPAAAMAGYAAALVLLALSCTARRVASLPLLPFLCASYLVCLVVLG